MPTLLVTGGAGFIGSCFLKTATERGYRLVVLDSLTYAGYRGNLAEFEKSGTSGFVFVEGDIRDPALAARLLAEHRPGAVVNFAAESHVDRSIEDAGDFIQTNLLGTFNLLRCSLGYWQSSKSPEREAFRYLQISTDEVYGSLGESGKFTEESPLQPNSPYSASKAGGDLLVRAWHHTYGLPTLTTNCTNNYGPRQFPEKLIPHMIQCALEGKSLPVYGDGKNVRDWIHVEDHCEGVLLALEKGAPGETYCFSGDAERRNIDVVRTICSALDEMRPLHGGKSYGAQIQFVTDRLGHDRRYAIDDSKAVRELGFRRKHGFESGLRETVRWYLENAAWVEAVTAKNKGSGGIS